MIIEDSFTVTADPDRVADFLLDVDRVAHCVPGVKDVTRNGDDSYEATLQVALGSIRPSFKGSIEVDRSRAPRHLSARAEGRDRSTGSLALVRFEAELRDAPPAETEVTVTADITIRGKLGQFGTGIIRSTAQEVLRQFASCANATLADETAGAAAQPRQPSMRSTVARGLLLYLRAVFVRLADKLRSARSHTGGRS